MTLPVVQAPVGRAATPELVAAVSGAGGLGMLAASWTPPGRLRALVRRVQELTERPFGVNLVLEWPQDERLDVALEEGVGVVSTAWGDPAPLVDRIHAAGAVHVHSVGSAADARLAADAGVDAVVAQGVEAGGHVLGRVSTLALVPAVVDAIAPLPVLAAGGIADGRGLAAVLSLGAEAAWIGTRFVASAEADAHEDYQARLVEATESDTVYGSVFDGGWQGAPHRTLDNSTLRRWTAAGRPGTDRPGEDEVVGATGRGVAVPRYSSDLPTRGTTGAVEAMALYAGQGVGVVHEVLPAADIARTLTRDARRVLARLAALADNGI
jgi:nitronate monooxygenase